MVKVKAHSGDRLNDKTDRLAKAAAFAAPRLNLKYSNLPEVSLVLTCDNLIVDASSRKSIKQLFNAKYFYETLQLQRHSDLKILTENQHINWLSTSFMLNHTSSDQDRSSTSFKQHRLRSFKYKIFSEELPILAKLKQRRPDLYLTDECLLCQRYAEIQAHLWLCLQNQE